MKNRSYRQIIRSAVEANHRVIAELKEANKFALSSEERQEVTAALGAARVLAVVLGNIQFDAEQGT